MYLAARIFGIMSYVLTLCLFLFLTRYAKYKTPKGILVAFALMLALMGYGFVPDSGKDLSRLIPIMQFYGRRSAAEVWNAMISSPTPLLPLYYYLIAKFNDDHMLCGITTLITFLCVFSTVWRAHEDFGASKRTLTLAVFWMLASGVFGQTIDGIRTMLAFAIITAGYYSENFRGRSFFQALPVYLCGAFLHSAGLVLMAIRVGFLFLQKSNSVWKKIATFLLGIVIVAAGAVLLAPQLARAINKAMNYITREMYSYSWNVIIGTISSVMMIYMCLKVKRYINVWENTGIKQKLLNHTNFVLVVAVISILSLPLDYSIFVRFMYGAAMMIAPVIMALLTNAEIPANLRIKVYNLLIVTGAVMTALAVTRGEICSLKFWE